jgi:four helix bundle protein
VRGGEMRYGKNSINGEMHSEVYNFVFETASKISEEITRASKEFPKEKSYLAALACRHSQLVCINLEEAWRMQEHRTIFLDKLSDAAQAASKTQDVLKFASKYNYIKEEIYKRIDVKYENMFEDIFEMLCDRNKMAEQPKSDGKAGSAYGVVVSAA